MVDIFGWSKGIGRASFLFIQAGSTINGNLLLTQKGLTKGPDPALWLYNNLRN
ncbi:hypothetical protein ACFPU1_01705 [Thalassorhabdus alkalitolerans]|uniref:Uncharacterized protein n=1 Tax=Thalassorhabdus alkalitolerans TaxID=2282697 RepID=A0ABW0YGE1_9BACI